MKLTAKQKLLFEFVKIKHGNQERKYTGEPYWTHPLEVAKMVEPNLIEVALCHDLLEDTDCDAPELLRELLSLSYEPNRAIEILQGVVDLTDVFIKEKFPKLNRKARKELEAERLGTISSNSQTVKYADLIDNTESIMTHDPKFGKTYLKEKRAMLELMNKGDSRMYGICKLQCSEI